MHVVNMDVVLEHAYDWGYDEFVGVSEDPDDYPGEYDAYLFTDSARYANIILPGLRQMSGYADAGAGTYAYTRDVVAVGQGVAHQYVTEGDEVASSELLDEVVSKFFEGAHDAVEDKVAEVYP